MYEKELDIAKRLALEAGEAIMKIYDTDFSHTIKRINLLMLLLLIV